MRCINHMSIVSLFLTIFSLYATVFTSALAPRRGLLAPDEARSFKANTRTSLVRREDLTPAVPDLDTCKQHLTVQKDQGVFYSSAVIESAKAYAKANGGVTIWDAGLSTYEQDLDAQAKQAVKDGKTTWGAEESDQFWVNMSKAFAAVSSGDVVVVLPAGPDGKPELPGKSFFTQYEWPILQDKSQNAGVTKVTAYVGNTDGSAPSGAGTVIWPC